MDKEDGVVHLYMECKTRKFMILHTHLGVLDHASNVTGRFSNCFFSFVHLSIQHFEPWKQENIKI